jgi:Arc/MetJ family transcription regulator
VLDVLGRTVHIVCMKRTNVVLDEELLERARKATGERTYSGAITKALSEYVRQHEFRTALRELQAVASPDFFWPGYLEEIRPNAYSVTRKRKVSADEHRLPSKQRRGAR